MTAPAHSNAPIFDGPEWTFELLEKMHDSFVETMVMVGAGE